MAKRHSTKRAQISAVAYYRMSSDRQEKSVAEQRDAVRKYAKQNGYRILHEYVDEGISGVDTSKRVEFQRMMRDALDKKWSAILCWNQDRFGRFDSCEAGFWIFPLREARVHLATVTQGRIDWDSFEGRVTYTVQQEGKHMYLQDMSRNLLRTKQQAASKGELFSTLPLGYKKSPPKIAPDENADLVHWAFEAYAENATVQEIAQYLYDHGVKSKKGDLINPGRVLKMLSNPIYVGRYEWGRTKKGKFNTATDLVVIENNHPAIVDLELFEKVHQARLRRKRKTTKAGQQRALSCLLKCGECGKTMAVNTGRGGRKTVYRCRGESYGHACRRLKVPADVIEPAILDALSAVFSAPEIQSELRAECAKEAKRRKGAAEKSPAPLQRRVHKLEEQLQQAKDRYVIEVYPDMQEVVREKIRSLTAELRAAEAELKTAQAAAGARSSADIEAEQREMIDFLANIKTHVLNLPAPEANRVISQVISSIDVNMDVGAGRDCRWWKNSRFKLLGGTIRLTHT